MLPRDGGPAISQSARNDTTERSPSTATAPSPTGRRRPPGNMSRAALPSRPLTPAPCRPSTDPRRRLVAQPSGTAMSGGGGSKVRTASVSFLDDQSLPATCAIGCHGGRIDDIPRALEAAGEWLGSSAGLVIAEPTPLTVGGSAGKRGGSQAAARRLRHQLRWQPRHFVSGRASVTDIRQGPRQRLAGHRSSTSTASGSSWDVPGRGIPRRPTCAAQAIIDSLVITP